MSRSPFSAALSLRSARAAFAYLLPMSAALGCGGDGAKSTSASDGPFVSFVDSESGESRELVHDVDREVVRFDAGSNALIWANGAVVRGWRISGNDLAWANSSETFRVVFGSEEGELRAFFTESLSGNLCDLALRASGTLSVIGTSQSPPEP